LNRISGPGSQTRSAGYSGFDKRAFNVAKIRQNQVAVNRWAKVVGLVVIAVMVFVLVAPDIDLQPTVSRVSHVVHKPPAVAFHAAGVATLQFAFLISVTSSRQTPLRATRDSSANLIDLKCSRLC
jgi:hypothetical protein